MKPKPVVPRSKANQDVEDAIAYFLEQDAVDAALGFIDALENAYNHIGRYPTAGSPRYAHELGIPELRFWLISGYTYLVFYVEHGDHIDVWRVLHGQRDMAAWLVE